MYTQYWYSSPLFTAIQLYTAQCMFTSQYV
jgi:hypothetical protein